MGTFYPEIKVYNVKEMGSFNLEITYLDDLLQPPQTLSITPNYTNPTISIINNIVSGYYSEVFEHYIRYRRPDYSYNQVNTFEEVHLDGIPLIYRFMPDQTPYVQYTYTVEVTGEVDILGVLTPYTETETYIVNVLNDWDYQRNRLFQVVNPELYEQLTIKWINNSSVVLPWSNNVTWITETWPWHS